MVSVVLVAVALVLVLILMLVSAICDVFCLAVSFFVSCVIFLLDRNNRVRSEIGAGFLVIFFPSSFPCLAFSSFVFLYAAYMETTETCSLVLLTTEMQQHGNNMATTGVVPTVNILVFPPWFWIECRLAPATPLSTEPVHFLKLPRHLYWILIPWAVSIERVENELVEEDSDVEARTGMDGSIQRSNTTDRQLDFYRDNGSG